MKYQFTNLALATNFANRCEKPHIIIMGDNGKLWVSTLAEAKKLISEGYEAI